MSVTSKQLKTSIELWNQRNNVPDYRCLVLKIKGTNIEVGNAIQYKQTDDICVVSCLSNISGRVREIPATSTLEDIHTAWEDAMDKLLSTITI